MSPTVQDALRVAARVGLPVPPEVIELDTMTGDLAARDAGLDRLSGMFAAAVEAGDIVVPEILVPQIRRFWHEGLVDAVGAEAALVRVASVLDDADVVWMVSKGAALAHLDYPTTAIRLFGDADVIIHPDHWALALPALERAGYAREFPELRPGFDDRFGKGATFHDPAGSEIDVHRRFAHGRFGVLSDMRDVFVDPDELELAGRRILVPNRTIRLVHASFHASLGGFRRFRAFRDVAQLLLVGDADWRAALTLLTRWRSECLLADAVLETWRRLRLNIDHEVHDWALSHRPSRRELASLASYQEAADFRRVALSAVTVLPVHQVPRYLVSLTFPASDARRARLLLGHRSLSERLSAVRPGRRQA